MLQPHNDRLDYANLLMPPEGFKLDNAVATSYSLDLDALIFIPVALYFAHSLDLNIKSDIVQILDSIRRASSTLKIFCQKGQIKVPENQHRLYSYIESCIVQIPPTQESSFHPKVWIIRFKNDSQDVKYRVIVLSRNLTFDRSGDVAFQIEGDYIKDRKYNFSETVPLIDFLNYLSNYEDINWLDSFVSDLGKTKFKLMSNDFDSFTFHPMGFKGYQKNILFDNHRYDELLIISPFITSGGLDLARKHSASKPHLFSREFELKKVNKEILSYFSAYHLSDDYIQGEEKLEADPDETFMSQLQDVHAKLYSYKSGWDAYLLLGSANCSKRAMENNIEFMIQLNGKNSKMGPKVILNELLNEELKIFQEYISNEQLTEQEEEFCQIEQELQDLKLNLVNAPIQASAIKHEDTNYVIELELNLTQVSNISNIEITTYLLKNENQQQSIKAGQLNSWRVYNVSELDISSFLIFQLDNSGVKRSFTIKIPIKNLPDTRNNKIFKDIISNSANFFKYIRFLLAESVWDEQFAFSNEMSKAINGNSIGNYFSQEEPIYENMLKTISREPDKLAEIKKVMDSLCEEENENEKIIPEDFKSLWKIFEEALVNKQ